jgi:hypothetical protein
MIIIKLVRWIGYAANSKMNLALANAIFFAYFFNTTIVLIFVYADFTHLPFIGRFFSPSLYPDYSTEWYTVVGEIIVTTESLRWIFPPIFEFSMMAISYLFQKLDQGISSKLRDLRVFRLVNGVKEYRTELPPQYSTQCTQIYQYLDLYVGPQFDISARYATVFTIVYVTLLFGIGMPVLFPIAAWNLIVIYLVERYVLAYFYRVPPTMDDRLVKNAMETLKFAPLLFLANSFWMLTNRQIFANDVSKV